ncbi:PEP-CTERM sorting domain-containing protein [Coraliomargarita algicola]|uniref:PEP-CTERM sorting domain-containing protein n=1 Tax=Coraliomargarita algicola TaxID=3092156 RepID=A0ABZ0RL08_9BACT|nr:PEP-CTERM sorting domain-containing protein [Coraliomargarita sp. J2-16]WPJ96106.1 PEP-CTERM sorting domain-containing protein [Coraliomargarita sp. J2-16]
MKESPQNSLVYSRTPKLACTLMSMLALAAGSLSAADLYLPNSSVGGTWDYTSLNWATTSGGSADTAWTNGNNVVIEFTGNSAFKLGESDLQAADFTGAAGRIIYLQGIAGEQNQLEVTGAGSGEVHVWGTSGSGATNTLKLSGSTGWDGTLKLRDGSHNRIVLSNASAFSTDTTLEFVSGGLLLLDAAIGGQTTTLGQLSGTSGAISANYGAADAGVKTLRVEQSTDTSFSGQFAAGTSGRELALSKAGTGSLTLTGALNHGGGVTAEAGELVITSAATTSGQGDYVVSNGATLRVDNTINFGAGATLTVEAGGALAPGSEASVGTLTLDGTSGAGLVFGDGATVDFRLGVSQDEIILLGSSMVGDALGGEDSIIFNFINEGMVEGDFYDLITFGDTPAIALSAFTSNLEGTFQYSGNILQFGYSVIPEPSSSVLMLGALAGGMVLLRRRTR